MADSLDRRLARIEKKLGLEEEQILQDFAIEVRQQFNGINHRLRRIERAVFGENDIANTGSANAVPASPYPDGPSRPNFGERI